MAKISFETVQETATENFGNSNDGVKFFSLKNNGDTAIVRIMHDSVEDFDIMTTHQINIDGKYRKISCIRDPREPIENCPFCATGAKLQQRFFVHMIQYVPDASGQIVPTPVVWERTAGEYATKLKTLIDEYGPLSENLFKIKRNGEPKSMDTTYEIMYAPPAAYPESAYPKVVDAFKDYSALGRVVLDKSYEEITQFLSTGSFPKSTNNTSEPTISAPASTAQSATFVPQSATQSDTTVANVGGERMPWEAPASAPGVTPATNRPVRRY